VVTIKVHVPNPLHRISGVPNSQRIDHSHYPGSRREFEGLHHPFQRTGTKHGTVPSGDSARFGIFRTETKLDVQMDPLPNKPQTYHEFLMKAQQHIMAEENMFVPSFPALNEQTTKAKESRPNKEFAKDGRSSQFQAMQRKHHEELTNSYQGVYSAGAAVVYEELKRPRNDERMNPGDEPDFGLNPRRANEHHNEILTI
ncbi:Unknown protein, partial [Striga hermonthica]